MYLSSKALTVVFVGSLVFGCTSHSPSDPSQLTVSSSASLAVSVPLNLRTHLNGRKEAPTPRDTRAQGQAIFQVDPSGESISYRLIASNIDNVTMSHIHMGPADGTGPIVVWLFPGTSPPANPPGGGRTDGVLAAGTFTAADLVGPLAGQSLSALLDAIAAGSAYVNVHTDDGVAPTNTGPGDFPGGEIRGQL